MVHPKIKIVRFLHEFFDEGFDGSQELTPPKERSRELLRQLTERFPKARKEDFEAAFADYQFDREAERQMQEEELADLERKLRFLRKHNIPDTSSYGAAVRAVAATGDPEALRLLAEFEGADQRVFLELLNAAVDVHPAWHRDGEGRYRYHGESEPSTPEALVDWFQLTYPRQARMIEDRLDLDLS